MSQVLVTGGTECVIGHTGSLDSTIAFLRRMGYEVIVLEGGRRGETLATLDLEAAQGILTTLVGPGLRDIVGIFDDIPVPEDPSPGPKTKQYGPLSGRRKKGRNRKW
jgi:hypothetical protein